MPEQNQPPLSPQPAVPAPAHFAWDQRPLPKASPAFVRMIGTLRSFLDRLALARPDDMLSSQIADTSAQWAEQLAATATPEEDRICGRLLDQPGRAYLMMPPYEVTHIDREHMEGRVTFGYHFLGRNGAVHGGILALLFDDLLGRLIHTDSEIRSRTAYMHVDYRAITPVDTPLIFRAMLKSEEGRKRIVRGEVWNGDTLCAEAEGLFIALKPHQP